MLSCMSKNARNGLYLLLLLDQSLLQVFFLENDCLSLSIFLYYEEKVKTPDNKLARCQDKHTSTSKGKQFKLPKRKSQPPKENYGFCQHFKITAAK